WLKDNIDRLKGKREIVLLTAEKMREVPPVSGCEIENHVGNDALKFMLEWIDHLKKVKAGTVKPSEIKRFVMTNYDQLSKLEELYQKIPGNENKSLLDQLEPDMLVVDEAHNIKNIKEKVIRTKLTRKIRAKYFIPLTGTPVENLSTDSEIYLRKIFGGEVGKKIEEEVFRISPFKDFNTFWKAYNKSINRNKPEYLSELNRILNAVMIRRESEDVMIGLPTKRKAHYILNLDDGTMQKWENDSPVEAPEKLKGDFELQKRLIEWLQGNSWSKDGYEENERLKRFWKDTEERRKWREYFENLMKNKDFRKLMPKNNGVSLANRVREAYSDLSLFGFTSADKADSIKFAALKHLISKMDEGIDDVSKKELILVYSEFVNTAEKIAGHNWSNRPAKHIHGQMTYVDRMAKIKLAQDGNIKILSAVAEAASESFNLNKAGTVLHFDNPWKPTTIDQGDARPDRFGNENEVLHQLTFGIQFGDRNEEAPSELLKTIGEPLNGTDAHIENILYTKRLEGKRTLQQGFMLEWPASVEIERERREKPDEAVAISIAPDREGKEEPLTIEEVEKSEKANYIPLDEKVNWKEMQRAVNNIRKSHPGSHFIIDPIKDNFIGGKNIAVAMEYEGHVVGYIVGVPLWKLVDDGILTEDELDKNENRETTLLVEAVFDMDLPPELKVLPEMLVAKMEEFAQGLGFQYFKTVERHKTETLSRKLSKAKDISPLKDDKFRKNFWNKGLKKLSELLAKGGAIKEEIIVSLNRMGYRKMAEGIAKDSSYEKLLEVLDLSELDFEAILRIMEMIGHKRDFAVKEGLVGSEPVPAEGGTYFYRNGLSYRDEGMDFDALRAFMAALILRREDKSIWLDLTNVLYKLKLKGSRKKAAEYAFDLEGVPTVKQLEELFKLISIDIQRIYPDKDFTEFIIKKEAPDIQKIIVDNVKIKRDIDAINKVKELRNGRKDINEVTSFREFVFKGIPFEVGLEVFKYIYKKKQVNGVVPSFERIFRDLKGRMVMADGKPTTITINRLLLIMDKFYVMGSEFSDEKMRQRFIIDKAKNDFAGYKADRKIGILITAERDRNIKQAQVDFKKAKKEYYEIESLENRYRVLKENLESKIKVSAVLAKFMKEHSIKGKPEEAAAGKKVLKKKEKKLKESEIKALQTELQVLLKEYDAVKSHIVKNKYEFSRKGIENLMKRLKRRYKLKTMGGLIIEGSIIDRLSDLELVRPDIIREFTEMMDVVLFYAHRIAKADDYEPLVNIVNSFRDLTAADRLSKEKEGLDIAEFHRPTIEAGEKLGSLASSAVAFGARTAVEWEPPEEKDEDESEDESEEDPIEGAAEGLEEEPVDEIEAEVASVVIGSDAAESIIGQQTDKIAKLNLGPKNNRFLYEKWRKVKATLLSERVEGMTEEAIEMVKNAVFITDRIANPIPWAEMVGGRVAWAATFSALVDEDEEQLYLRGHLLKVLTEDELVQLLVDSLNIVNGSKIEIRGLRLKVLEKLEKIAYLESRGVHFSQIQTDILMIPMYDINEAVEGLVADGVDNITEADIKNSLGSIREERIRYTEPERAASLLGRVLADAINEQTLYLNFISEEDILELSSQKSFIEVLAYGLSAKSVRRLVSLPASELSIAERVIKEEILGRHVADGWDWNMLIYNVDSATVKQENSGLEFLSQYITTLLNMTSHADKLNKMEPGSLGTLMYQRALMRLNLTYWQKKYGVYASEKYGDDKIDRNIRETFLNLVTFVREPHDGHEDGYREFGDYRSSGLVKYPLNWGLTHGDLLIDLTATQHGAFHQACALNADPIKFYTENREGKYYPTPAKTPMPVDVSKVIGNIAQAETGTREDVLYFMGSSHSEALILRFYASINSKSVEEVVQEVIAEIEGEEKLLKKDKPNMKGFRNIIRPYALDLMKKYESTSANNLNDLLNTFDGIYLTHFKEMKKTLVLKEELYNLKQNINEKLKKLEQEAKKIEANIEKTMEEIEKLEEKDVKKRERKEAQLMDLEAKSIYKNREIAEFPDVMEEQKRDLEEKIAQSAFEAYLSMYATKTENETSAPRVYAVSENKDYNVLLEKFGKHYKTQMSAYPEKKLDTYSRGPRKGGMLDYYYAGGDPVKTEFLSHVLYRLPEGKLPEGKEVAGGIDPATAITVIQAIPKNIRELIEAFKLNNAEEYEGIMSIGDKEQLETILEKLLVSLEEKSDDDWQTRFQRKKNIDEIEVSQLRLLLERLKKEELKELLGRFRKGERIDWSPWITSKPKVAKKDDEDHLVKKGEYDQYGSPEDKDAEKKEPVPSLDELYDTKEQNELINRIVRIMESGGGIDEVANMSELISLGLRPSDIREWFVGFTQGPGPKVYTAEMRKPRAYAHPGATGSTMRNLFCLLTGFISEGVFEEQMADYIAKRTASTNYWLFKEMTKIWQKKFKENVIDSLKGTFGEVVKWSGHYKGKKNIRMFGVMGDYLLSTTGWDTVEVVVGQEETIGNRNIQKLDYDDERRQGMEKAWKVTLIQKELQENNIEAKPEVVKSIVESLSGMYYENFAEDKESIRKDISNMIIEELPDYKELLKEEVLKELSRILLLRMEVTVVKMDWLTRKGIYAKAASQVNERSELLAKLVSSGVTMTGPDLSKIKILDYMPSNSDLLNVAKELIESVNERRPKSHLLSFLTQKKTVSGKIAFSEEVAFGRLSLADAILAQATRVVPLEKEHIDEKISGKPSLNEYTKEMSKRVKKARKLLLEEQVHALMMLGARIDAKVSKEKEEDGGWLGGYGEGDIGELFKMVDIPMDRRLRNLTKPEAEKIAVKLDEEAERLESVSDEELKKKISSFSDFVLNAGNMYGSEGEEAMPLEERYITEDMRVVRAEGNKLEVATTIGEKATVEIKIIDTPELIGQKRFEMALMLPDPRPGPKGRYVVYFQKALLDAEIGVQTFVVKSIIDQLKKVAQGDSLYSARETTLNEVKNEDMESVRHEKNNYLNNTIYVSFTEGRELTMLSSAAGEEEPADDGEEPAESEEDEIYDGDSGKKKPEHLTRLTDIKPEQFPLRLAQAIADYIHEHKLKKAVLINDTGARNEKGENIAELQARIIAANDIDVHFVKKGVSLNALAHGTRQAGIYTVALSGMNYLGPLGDTFPLEKSQYIENLAASLDGYYISSSIDMAELRLGRFEYYEDDMESAYLASVENDKALDIAKVREGNKILFDLRAISKANEGAVIDFLNKTGVASKYMTSEKEGILTPGSKEDDGKLAEMIQNEGEKQIGVRFDGNAQRMILYDRTGRVMLPEELSLIFTWYLAGKGLRYPVVKAPSEPKIMEVIARRLGLSFDKTQRLTKDGEKLILEGWRPWNDITSQAILAAQIVEEKGTSLEALLDTIYEEIGQPNIDKTEVLLYTDHRTNIESIIRGKNVQEIAVEIAKIAGVPLDGEPASHEGEVIQVDFKDEGRLSIIMTPDGVVVQGEAPGRPGMKKDLRLAKRLKKAGEKWVKRQKPPAYRPEALTAGIFLLGVLLAAVAIWLLPLYFPQPIHWVMDQLEMLTRYMRMLINISLYVIEFMVAILLSSVIEFLVFTTWRKALVKKIKRPDRDSQPYNIHPMITRSGKKIVFVDNLPNAMNSWALFQHLADGTIRVHAGIKKLPPIVQAIFFARDVVVSKFTMQERSATRPPISGILFRIWVYSLLPVIIKPKYIIEPVKYLFKSMLPVRRKKVEVEGGTLTTQQLRAEYDTSNGGDYKITTGKMVSVGDGDGGRVLLADGTVHKLRFMDYNSFGNGETGGELGMKEALNDYKYYDGRLTLEHIMHQGRVAKDRANSLLMNQEVIVLLRYRNGRPVTAYNRNISHLYMRDPDNLNKWILVTNKLKELMGGPAMEDINWNNAYKLLEKEAKRPPAELSSSLEAAGAKRAPAAFLWLYEVFKVMWTGASMILLFNYLAGAIPLMSASPILAVIAAVVGLNIITKISAKLFFSRGIFARDPYGPDYKVKPKKSFVFMVFVVFVFSLFLPYGALMQLPLMPLILTSSGLGIAALILRILPRILTKDTKAEEKINIVSAGPASAEELLPEEEAIKDPYSVLKKKTIKLLKKYGDKAGKSDAFFEEWRLIVPGLRRIGVDPSKVLEAWEHSTIKAGIGDLGISRTSTNIPSPVKLPADTLKQLEIMPYRKLERTHRKQIETAIIRMLGLSKRPNEAKDIDIDKIDGRTIKKLLEGGKMQESVDKGFMQNRAYEQWLWNVAVEEEWSHDLIKALSMLSAFTAQMRIDEKFNSAKTLIISPLTIMEVIHWIRVTNSGLYPEKWHGELDLKVMLIDEDARSDWQRDRKNKSFIPKDASVGAEPQYNVMFGPHRVRGFPSNTKVGVNITRVGGDWFRKVTKDNERNELRYEFLQGITVYGDIMKRLIAGDFQTRDDMYLTAARHLIHSARKNLPIEMGKLFKKKWETDGYHPEKDKLAKGATRRDAEYKIDLAIRMLRHVMGKPGNAEVAKNTGLEWGLKIADVDENIARQFSADIHITNLFSRALMMTYKRRSAPAKGGIIWGSVIRAKNDAEIEKIVEKEEVKLALRSETERKKAVSVISKLISAGRSLTDDVIIIQDTQTHAKIEVRVELAERKDLPRIRDASDLYKWGSITRAGPLTLGSNIDRYKLILDSKLMELEPDYLRDVIRFYISQIKELSGGAAFDDIRMHTPPSPKKIKAKLEELIEGLRVRRLSSLLPKTVEITKQGWLNTPLREEVLRTAQGMLRYWETKASSVDRPCLVSYSGSGNSKEMAEEVARIIVGNGRKAIVSTGPTSLKALKNAAVDTTMRIYITDNTVCLLGAEGKPLRKKDFSLDMLGMSIYMTKYIHFDVNRWNTLTASGKVEMVDLSPFEGPAEDEKYEEEEEILVYPESVDTGLPRGFPLFNLLYAGIFLALLVGAVTIPFWNPELTLRIMAMYGVVRFLRYALFFFLRPNRQLLIGIITLSPVVILGAIHYWLLHYISKRNVVKQVLAEKDFEPSTDLPKAITRYPVFEMKTEEATAMKDFPFVREGDNGLHYVNHKAFGVAYSMYKQSTLFRGIGTLVTFGLRTDAVAGWLARMRLMLLFEYEMNQAWIDGRLEMFTKTPIGFMVVRGRRFYFLFHALLFQPASMVRSFFRSLMMFIWPKAHQMGNTLPYLPLPANLARQGYVMHMGTVSGTMGEGSASKTITLEDRRKVRAMGLEAQVFRNMPIGGYLKHSDRILLLVPPETDNMPTNMNYNAYAYVLQEETGAEQIYIRLDLKVRFERDLPLPKTGVTKSMVKVPATIKLSRTDANIAARTSEGLKIKSERERKKLLKEMRERTPTMGAKILKAIITTMVFSAVFYAIVGIGLPALLGYLGLGSVPIISNFTINFNLFSALAGFLAAPGLVTWLPIFATWIVPGGIFLSTMFLLTPPSPKRTAVVESGRAIFSYLVLGWITIFVGGSGMAAWRAMFDSPGMETIMPFLTIAVIPIFMFFMIYRIIFMGASGIQDRVADTFEKAADFVSKIFGKSEERERYKKISYLEQGGKRRSFIWKLFPFITAGLLSFMARAGWAQGASAWIKEVSYADLEKEGLLRLGESETFAGISDAGATGIEAGFMRLNELLTAGGKTPLSDDKIRELLDPLRDEYPNDHKSFKAALEKVAENMDEVAKNAFGQVEIKEIEAGLKVPFTGGIFRGLQTEFFEDMPGSKNNAVINAKGAIRQLLVRWDETMDDLTNNIINSVGAEAEKFEHFEPAVSARYAEIMRLSFDNRVRSQLEFIARLHPELKYRVTGVLRELEDLRHAKVSGKLIAKELRELGAASDRLIEDLKELKPFDPRGAAGAQSIVSEKGGIQAQMGKILPSESAELEQFTPGKIYSAYVTLEDYMKSILSGYIMEGMEAGLPGEIMYVNYKNELMENSPQQISNAFEQKIMPVLKLLVDEEQMLKRLDAIEDELEKLKALSSKAAESGLTDQMKNQMGSRMRSLSTAIQRLMAEAFSKREKVMLGKEGEGLVEGHPREHLLKASVEYRNGKLSKLVNDALKIDPKSREGLQSGQLIDAYREIEEDIMQDMNKYIRIRISDINENLSKIMEYVIKERNWAHYLLSVGTGVSNFYLQKYQISINQDWIEGLFKEDGKVAPLMLRMWVVHNHLLLPSYYNLSGGDDKATQEFSKLFDEVFGIEKESGKMRFDVKNHMALSKAMETYFKKVDAMNQQLPGVRRHGEAVYNIQAANKMLKLGRYSDLVDVGSRFAKAGVQHYVNAKKDAFAEDIFEYRQSELEPQEHEELELPDRYVLGGMMRSEYTGAAWFAFKFGLSFIKDPGAVNSLKAAYMNGIGSISSEYSQTMEETSIMAPISLGLEEPNLVAVAVANPKEVAPFIADFKEQHLNFLEKAERLTGDTGLVARYRNIVSEVFQLKGNRRERINDYGDIAEKISDYVDRIDPILEEVAQIMNAHYDKETYLKELAIMLQRKSVISANDIHKNNEQFLQNTVRDAMGVARDIKQLYDSAGGLEDLAEKYFNDFVAEMGRMQDDYETYVSDKVSGFNDYQSAQNQKISDAQGKYTKYYNQYTSNGSSDGSSITPAEQKHLDELQQRIEDVKKDVGQNIGEKKAEIELDIKNEGEKLDKEVLKEKEKLETTADIKLTELARNTVGVVPGGSKGIIGAIKGLFNIGLYKRAERLRMAQGVGESSNVMFDYLTKTLVSFGRQNIDKLSDGSFVHDLFEDVDTPGEYSSSMKTVTDELVRAMYSLKCQAVLNASIDIKQGILPADTDMTKLGRYYDIYMDELEKAYKVNFGSAKSLGDIDDIEERLLRYAGRVQQIWNIAVKHADVDKAVTYQDLDLVNLVKDTITKDPTQAAGIRDYNLAVERLVAAASGKVTEPLKMKPAGAAIVQDLSDVDPSLFPETVDAKKFFKEDVEVHNKNLLLQIKGARPNYTSAHLSKLQDFWDDAASLSEEGKKDKLLEYLDLLDKVFLDIDPRYVKGTLPALIDQSLQGKWKAQDLVDAGLRPLIGISNGIIANLTDLNIIKEQFFPALYKDVITDTFVRNVKDAPVAYTRGILHYAQELNKSYGLPINEGIKTLKEDLLVEFRTPKDANELFTGLKNVAGYLDKYLDGEIKNRSIYERYSLIREFNDEISNISVKDMGTANGLYSRLMIKAMEVLENAHTARRNTLTVYGSIPQGVGYEEFGDEQYFGKVIEGYVMDINRLRQYALYSNPGRAGTVNNVFNGIINSINSAYESNFSEEITDNDDLSTRLFSFLATYNAAVNKGILMVNKNYVISHGRIIEVFEEQIEKARKVSAKGELDIEDIKSGLAASQEVSGNIQETVISDMSEKHEVMLSGELQEEMFKKRFFAGEQGAELLEKLQMDITHTHGKTIYGFNVVYPDSESRKLLQPLVELPDFKELQGAPMEEVQKWAVDYAEKFNVVLQKVGVRYPPGTLTGKMQAIVNAARNPAEALQNGLKDLYISIGDHLG
ncbi:SNF2-related protein, partial [Elusimicrobiota bacterium]